MSIFSFPCFIQFCMLIRFCYTYADFPLLWRLNFLQSKSNNAIHHFSKQVSSGEILFAIKDGIGKNISVANGMYRKNCLPHPVFPHNLYNTAKQPCTSFSIEANHREKLFFGKNHLHPPMLLQQNGRTKKDHWATHNKTGLWQHLRAIVAHEWRVTYELKGFSNSIMSEIFFRRLL